MDASLPPVFNLWDIAEQPPEVRLSLSAQNADPHFSDEGAGYARWRLDLAADPAQAKTQLAETKANLQAVERTLSHVDANLIVALTASGNSFSGPVAGSTPGPAELEVRAMLGAVRVQAVSGAQFETQVSFGLEDTFGDWVEAGRQLTATFTRLTRQISHAAWVETQIEGQLLGQTIIGWAGDTRTVWGSVRGSQLALHQESLSLALASRHTLLRTLMVTAEGAAKIARVLAVPGGQLLALPIAWKYVSRIISELEATYT